jgi:hypothetical protein
MAGFIQEVVEKSNQFSKCETEIVLLMRVLASIGKAERLYVYRSKQRRGRLWEVGVTGWGK